MRVRRVKRPERTAVGKAGLTSVQAANDIVQAAHLGFDSVELALE